MRQPLSPALTAGLLFLALAQGQLCSALDWDAFDSPKAVLLTEPFAKSISELPEEQKTPAIQRVREALNSSQVEIRRRAALTLGVLGDKSGVPIMITDLSTATGNDRDNVAVALRVLKDPRAIPALRQTLKDKSPYLRSIALAALGEMKASEAYADIVAHTKDKERDGGCIPSSPARLACYALGALGDPRGIAVLIDLVHDEDLKVSAMQALEVITGQKLGYDSSKWIDWWKQHPQ